MKQTTTSVLKDITNKTTGLGKRNGVSSPEHQEPPHKKRNRGVKKSDAKVDNFTPAGVIEKQLEPTFDLSFGSGNDKIDLHKNTSCKKNPDHKDFIPLEQFGVRHLPEGYGNQGLLRLVEALSKLIVLIRVDTCSSLRPKFFPDTEHKYLHFVGTTTGSGKIRFAETKTGTVSRHCLCDLCSESKTPETNWGEIKIITAAHVVFNNEEAKQTTCSFEIFGTKVVTKGGRATVDVKSDRCELICYTHDLSIISKLIKAIFYFTELHSKINKMYKSLSEKNLAILVSHPHGYPKYVTVGKWIKRQVKQRCNRTAYTKYTYTTCTCPGSSGAPVYILGKEKVWTTHPHSGSCDGHNFSGFEWENFYPGHLSPSDVTEQVSEKHLE
ncbi:uncharacterized protein LOC131948840 [Physella acuta]|uniref:uncharacterized protein LOC131948840 n=1 Tax=Physella acuta TaxID=109671 RepID=UPI0027DDCEF5|nr:uncharacterized protein LOC131948840 [Physella acuta]